MGRRGRMFRVLVTGRSMVPALRPGDRLVAMEPDRLRRGEVWVIRHGGALLVKRMIGLPGDRVWVEEGRARVVGSPHPGVRPGPQPDGSWILGPDEFLVQGDNREESTDLRSFGPVGPDALLGRVRFRYWPRPGPVR